MITWAMEHDPDIEALTNALDGLIKAQFVRQRPLRLYDEVDELAASFALSKIPTLDEPL